MIPVVTLLLLLLSKYSSAQGGCNPAPTSLLGGAGTHAADGVPTITASGSILQPKVGGQNVDAWSVFRASQVHERGLWCQVSLTTNESSIGDWYYPSGNGFTVVPSSTISSNSSSNSTSIPAYQSLKCTSQIGLVVDVNLTNNQGVVRCTTTVPNLNSTDTIYWVVYSDAVLNNYAGPTVEPNLTLTVLSPRDADPDIEYSFSFTVSFGPPSSISCMYNDSIQVFSGRGIHPQLSYDVIRSQYVNSSLPDMTRVTVRLPPQPREGRTYNCTVTVEGRVNIANIAYDYDQKGAGSSTSAISVAGTPTGVTVSRTGLTSAKVSWSALSPAPAGYEVFYQEKTEAGNDTINTSESLGNTSNTELILTEMTLGETYSIFVVAYEAEGAPVLPSAHSNTVTVSFAIPQLIAPTLTSTISSIMVSWSAPEIDAENYILSYLCQLECSILLPAQEDEEELKGDATDYVISPLDFGSTCSVNLTAVYGNSSSNTVTSSTSTLSAVPIGAPGGLTGKLVKKRSLTLVWGAVPCSDQRGPITGYKLRYSNGTSIVSTTGEENRERMITGLTPFTSYSVQVAGVNDGGTGPYSTPLIVETLQDVPGPVSGLSTTPEVLQLTISWNPPSEPNGRITAYQIRYRTERISIIDTSATRHTLEGFRPNTLVIFSITAYTIEGPGENVTIQKSTGTVPKVSRVNVGVINATAVRLFWSPINLPVVDHFTIYYMLFRRERQSESGTVNITAGSSSGVVSGLMTGEQYQFSVSVTVSGGGQYYTGPVSDPTDPVTVAAPPLFSTVTLSITAVGWGLVLLLGIIIIIVIIAVLLINNLKPKNKIANQIDESELTNHEDMKNRMRPDRLTVISM